MDHRVVVEKAIKLGCTVEQRGSRIMLTTPGGARIPTSVKAHDSMAGLALAGQLKRAGVDVRNGVHHGPVHRVDESTMFCKERRCARIECPRNWLGIDFKKGPKEKDINWTSFRNAACGYKPIKGCAGVVWTGEPPTPRLCELGVHESGPHAVTPAPVEAPKPAPEPAPEPAQEKQAPVEIPAEKWLEMAELVKAGESQHSVAIAYGVSQATLSRKIADMDGRQRLAKLRNSKHGLQKRRAAVKRILAGELPADVARDLGASPKVVTQWAHDPRLGGDPNYDGVAAWAKYREGKTLREIASRGNAHEVNGHAPAEPPRRNFATKAWPEPPKQPEPTRSAPIVIDERTWHVPAKAPEPPPVETRVAPPAQSEIAPEILNRVLEAAEKAKPLPPKPKPKRHIKYCVFCGVDVAELVPLGVRYCPDCGHSFAGVL